MNSGIVEKIFTGMQFFPVECYFIVPFFELDHRFSAIK